MPLVWRPRDDCPAAHPHRPHLPPPPAAFCLLCIAAKAYLDHWGPHSPRGKARAAAATAAAPASGKAEGGSVGRCCSGGGGGELAAISVTADSSNHGGRHFYKGTTDNRLLFEVVLPAGGAPGDSDSAEGDASLAEGPASAASALRQRLLSGLQHAVQEAAPGGALRALPAAA